MQAFRRDKNIAPVTVQIYGADNSQHRQVLACLRPEFIYRLMQIIIVVIIPREFLSVRVSPRIYRVTLKYVSSMYMID